MKNLHVIDFSDEWMAQRFDRIMAIPWQDYLAFKIGYICGRLNITPPILKLLTSFDSNHNRSLGDQPDTYLAYFERQEDALAFKMAWVD